MVGAHSLPEFIAFLKRPRRIMLMVKAGDPVDEFIDLCLPYLKKGISSSMEATAFSQIPIDAAQP